MWIGEEGVGKLARSQAAVGLIAAIGETFRGDQETCESKFLEHDRASQANHDDIGAPAPHAFGDGTGQFAVSCGLVVQRAVRLYMSDARTQGFGNFIESYELPVDGFGNFFRAALEFVASEVGRIFVTRVGTDGDIMARRLFDSGTHGEGVAGVSPAGDVGGTHVAHQVFLSAVGDGLGHFAHIAVDVDLFHTTKS